MDHGHEHEHDHHHGHEHTHHDHGHAHGAGDYYLEQLLTIFICGAFGLVAILMNSFGMLDHILAPQFHSWVLGGGIVLLAFVIIRGAALWVSAGSHAHAQAHHHHHDHAHEHGPDCDHSHEHGPGCDHGHDHPHENHGAHEHAHAHAPGDDHSHGNIFWRVVVMAFPLLLFCLGLPNSGLSKEGLDRRLGKDAEIGDIKEVAAKGGDVVTFNDFSELNAAANDPGKRTEYEGREVRVKGQLKKLDSTEYTLFKMKMTCCAADMIPLKARIKTSFATQFEDYKWVWAQGRLQFVESSDKRQYVPVVRVKNPSGLQEAPAE